MLATWIVKTPNLYSRLSACFLGFLPKKLVEGLRASGLSSGSLVITSGFATRIFRTDF